MIELFEKVTLKRDLPQFGLTAGAAGTVVEIYPATDGLEVEFFDNAGETIAVVTLDEVDVARAVGAKSSAR